MFEAKGAGAEGDGGEMAAQNTASSTLVSVRGGSSLPKTSLGIPRRPVDDRLGVALSINVEGPISAPVGPHAVLTETRWETGEWVSYSP